MTSFGKLTRREEFLAARKGRRWSAAAFTAQIARRAAADEARPLPRVGLTVSKKTGDAVERSRIKRRLRAAVRASDAGRAEPGADYVLIARREALTQPFDRLAADVAAALATPASAPRRRGA